MHFMEEKINLVLAGWNPIPVDAHVALDEYSGYVPSLIEAIKQDRVYDRLFEILTGMGMASEFEDTMAVQELQTLAELLTIVYNQG